MGTGFALVLRFCGTLGHGFVGSAGFGGGTGNGVRFGDGDGGCDGRSGKGGGGLKSERFRFGFGFRHLGRFDFAVNNIVQVVIAADDEQRLANQSSWVLSWRMAASRAFSEVIFLSKSVMVDFLSWLRV